MKVLLIGFFTNGAMGQYLHLLSQSVQRECETMISAPVHYQYIKDWSHRYIPIKTQKGNKLKILFYYLNPFAFISWLKKIHQASPEIIHIINGEYYPWVIPLIAYCYLTQKKIVFSVHDPDIHPGSFIDFLAGRIRLLTMLFIKNIHLLSQEFQSYYPDKNKFVIPLGNAGPLFGATTGEHFPHKTPSLFLFFGRLEYYKGVDILVEAIEKIEESRNGHFRFIIAGPGKLDEELETKIKKLKSIELLNFYLSDEEVGELFRKSEFLILPYRQATQSSLPLIAASFGTNVIGTRVGDFKWILPEIKGTVVDPDSQSLYEAIIGARFSEIKCPLHYEFSEQAKEYKKMYQALR